MYNSDSVPYFLPDRKSVRPTFSPSSRFQNTEIEVPFVFLDLIGNDRQNQKILVNWYFFACNVTGLHQISLIKTTVWHSCITPLLNNIKGGL